MPAFFPATFKNASILKNSANFAHDLSKPIAQETEVLIQS